MQRKQQERVVKITTANTLFPIYGYNWFNNGMLSEEGEARKAELLKTQVQPELKKSVVNDIRTHAARRFHNWAERAQRIRDMLFSVPIQEQSDVFAFQEVSYARHFSNNDPTDCSSTLVDLVPSSSVAIYSAIDVSTGDSDVDNELKRGNAISVNPRFNSLQNNGSFEVEITNVSENKVQTRRTPCAIFDFNPLRDSDQEYNPHDLVARMMVCSVQIPGYDSRGPTYKGNDPKKFAGFMARYPVGQNELQEICTKIDVEAKQRGVDFVVMTGDFNQCLKTHDNVTTVSSQDVSEFVASIKDSELLRKIETTVVRNGFLKTRLQLLEENGYTVDKSFSESTTEFGRTLDYAAVKNLNPGKFAVNSKLSLVQQTSDRPASDHKFTTCSVSVSPVGSKY